MENQRVPDGVNPEELDNEGVVIVSSNKVINIPAWAFIITLCGMVATGSWALSAEVHNYRLQNITTRLKTQEVRFLDFMGEKNDADAERDTLIEHNTTVNDAVLEDVKEIKTDIREVKNILLNGNR